VTNNFQPIFSTNSVTDYPTNSFSAKLTLPKRLVDSSLCHVAAHQMENGDMTMKNNPLSFPSLTITNFISFNLKKQYGNTAIWGHALEWGGTFV
jgi:hypothetical protein